MPKVANEDYVEPTTHEEELDDEVDDLSEDDSDEDLEEDSDDLDDEADEEDGDDDEGDDEDGDEPKASKGAPKSKPNATRSEKRINQLIFEKYELQRQMDALKDENDQLRAHVKELQSGGGQQQVANGNQEQRPTRADFDYDEDAYIEGVAQWSAKQAVANFANQQSQQTSQVAEQEAVASWNKKRSKYVQDNPDYIDLVKERGQAVTSKALAEYITSSEVGVKLHHKLLDDFGELQRIQALPEWKIGAELAKLESKLTRRKPKERSNAPRPNEPVQSRSSGKSGGGVSLPTNW